MMDNKKNFFGKLAGYAKTSVGFKRIENLITAKLLRRIDFFGMSFYI